MPDRMPVTVEKNRPNMEKNDSPGKYSGPELFRMFTSLYPVTPCSVEKLKTCYNTLTAALQELLSTIYKELAQNLELHCTILLT